MTELKGSDGRAISNQGNFQGGPQPESGALQSQASDLMAQRRPGLGQMLSRLTHDSPRPQLQMQQGKMDTVQPAPASNSMEVPNLYGMVEFYSMNGKPIQRHGKVSWVNNRPVWKDLDDASIPPYYGRVEPASKTVTFDIDCPTNSQMGARRDTIIVKPAFNPDGSNQAELVSTYPYARNPNPPARYFGGVHVVQESQPPTPQPQSNSEAIGSVMPGQPVYQGGMDQSTNSRAQSDVNYGNDPNARIAELERQNQMLQQQNQQMKDDKGHPIRDAVLGLGMMGLGAAMQIGRQQMYNRGGYGGYGRYGGGYGIPFLNNRGYRRR